MNLENQEVFLESEENKLKEKCGILGIYLNKKDRTDSFNAAKMAYYGLYALQHRGQECAGISVSNGEKIEAHKGLGLVADVFTAQKLEEMAGQIAVGHVLYSTSGEAQIENAQPFVSRFKLGGIAVAHNGAWTNYEQLKEVLEETGSTFTSALTGSTSGSKSYSTTSASFL